MVPDPGDLMVEEQLMEGIPFVKVGVNEGAYGGNKDPVAEKPTEGTLW